MKGTLVALVAVVLLSACGGSSGGGEDRKSDEFPLSSMECTGTITGVDRGDFKLSYDFETDKITLHTDTQNAGTTTTQGEISFEDGVYLWHTAVLTGEVFFNEDDYSITGTWKNIYDGAKGKLKGTCSEI